MKMLGKFTQVCGIGACRCSNAHDGKGRKSERRHIKHTERQKVSRQITED